MDAEAFFYLIEKENQLEIEREKDMNFTGIKQIPTGLATTIINGNEIGIAELAFEGILVRTATKLTEIKTLQINFLHFAESRYEEIQIEQFCHRTQKKERFYYESCIEIENEIYKKEVARLFRDYAEYIELKSYEDDVYLSSVKAGYPVEQEEDFAESFWEQKREWCKQLEVSKDFQKQIKSFEFAIQIDTQEKYEQYLLSGMESFYIRKLEEYGLENHPIAKERPSRVYLGNQFCHNLFPRKETLCALLEQAKKEKLNITIETTYLRESMIPEVEEMLYLLRTWCKKQNQKVEVVMNDYGMAGMVKKFLDCFIPVYGILLNKRRKDPRYPYKIGYEKYGYQLARNHLNNEEFQAYLKEYGIMRYEYENCNYEICVAEGNHSLHFPYYQTNTSQYCTLYAKCHTKERGNQSFVTNCPHYCNEYAFLYPKHLKMVGAYNSLFGFDASVLEGRIPLDKESKGKIDRLVLSLL